MTNEKEGQITLPSKRDDLPIGRDTEFILKEWMRISCDLPKLPRHLILPNIIKMLAAMVSDVYFANAAKAERKFHLTNYIARLQSVKSLTRVLHETKAISHKRAAYLFRLYEGISQQAVKWKNYSRDDVKSSES